MSLCKSIQTTSHMQRMLSNDEIGHILSFLDWRDLIFCSMHVNAQFNTQTIKSLQRIMNILIYCNADDCFCIEYLNAHHIRLSRLSNINIHWNGHENVRERTTIINNFIMQYKSQLQSLNLQQSAQSIIMLTEIAKKQDEDPSHRMVHDPNSFSSMTSLIINDYIMHSLSFNFFNLFGSIKDLRISGHLLYRPELEMINRCCKSLRCLQITIHDAVACAELIENNKHKFEILSINMGYIAGLSVSLWRALSRCSVLKVLRITEALLLQVDVDQIFPRQSAICNSIQIVEIQTFDWKAQSVYDLKLEFPKIQAFQRVDPMLYEVKAVKCTNREIIRVHCFQAEWNESKSVWKFQWL
eukprot:109417_1